MSDKIIAVLHGGPNDGDTLALSYLVPLIRTAPKPPDIYSAVDTAPCENFSLRYNEYFSSGSPYVVQGLTVCNYYFQGD